MGVPIVYRKQQESSIATYDFTDLITKTGGIFFYGNAYNLSGSGISYFIDQNQFYPSSSGYNNDGYKRENNFKTAVLASATNTKVIDIDFDTNTFVVPQVIKGNFLINIPFGHGVGDTASYATWYFIAKLIKVDAASAETTLLTLSSNIFSNDAGANAQEIHDLYATMGGSVPQTLIKIGEKLRITLEVYMAGTAGKSVTIGVYFDANNRAATSDSAALATQTAGYTQLSCLLPFKIDI